MELWVFCEAEARMAQGPDPDYWAGSCLSQQWRQRQRGLFFFLLLINEGYLWALAHLKCILCLVLGQQDLVVLPFFQLLCLGWVSGSGVCGEAP